MLFKSTTFVLMSSLALATFTTPAEARIARSKKSRSGTASAAQPLVFRSTGSGGAMGKVKHRDRTVTFLRQGRAVKVWIKDHIAHNVVSGTMSIGPERELLTDDPELANAANILAITPAVLADLRADSNVITDGVVEANGKVYNVESEHQLQRQEADGGATVLTRTRSTDGKLRLETVSRVDRNGVPLTASTRGRLKVFLFNADIQVNLQRVSGTGI
jgi:hypothetical protein